MTEYSNYAILITLNKDVGNALASLAASFPNDPRAEQETFHDGRELSPEAWYAVIPCKQNFASVINSLKERVAYSDPRLAYLIDRGMTLEQWNMSDAIFPYVEVFVRSEVDGTDFVTPFITSHGYSIVEDNAP